MCGAVARLGALFELVPADGVAAAQTWLCGELTIFFLFVGSRHNEV